MTNYLLWDIDGTLMLTNYAGVAALKEALQKIYGLEDFEFTFGMSGRTDRYIARKAIEGIKDSWTPEESKRMLEFYATLLPASLARKKGHLLPHVKECLAWAEKNPQVKSVLLTGNCEPAAHAKLAHFGIENYFDYSLSAFGEISELRDDLSVALWKKLKAADPAVRPEDLIIIGDTPHDIRCAHAIGARSLIVLTGSVYKKEQLEAEHPWKIIPELPANPEELLDLVKEEHP